MRHPNAVHQIEARPELGFPEEAFTEAALFWTYVLNERQQYQALRDQGDSGAAIVERALLAHLKVDSNYVTELLTDDQAQAANAWKIAYLNRLQQQNTDPSYINAYLQAWNLPASALSASPKK